MKKLLVRLGLLAGLAGAVTIGAAGVAGMQSAVVNVTAEIENALTVDPGVIDFGTVFPQEYLEESLNISLSDSFVEEDRVDDVKYVIKQKPKVKLFDPESEDPNNDPIPGDPWATITPPGFPEGIVAWKYCEENLPPDSDENDNIGYTVDLDDPYWQYCYLPLANSLSKHETTPDGTEGENDTSVNAFHEAYLWDDEGNVTLNPDFIATGRLVKSAGDTEDNWIIDLKVPCFYGQCAQEAYDKNNGVDDDIPGFHVPVQFQLDPKTEHKTFGTDLWIEVTEYSYSNGTTPPPPPPDPTPPPPPVEPPPPPVEPPPPPPAPAPPPPAPETGTLKIQKIVENNGVGTAVIGDFSFKIDGGSDVAAGDHEVDAGLHQVTENPGPAGYTATFSNDCDADGNINVPASGTATCTVTNTFTDFGTITVTKVVINDNGGNAVIENFDLFVDANGVTSGESNNFAPGTYTISETGVAGYTALFSGDCDANTHQIELAAGDDLTCTITNNDIAPIVTLNKSVMNDNGGTAQPNEFIMRVDGTPVPHSSSIAVLANDDIQITEDAKAGYTFVSITGTGCPADLATNFQLAPGQSITCTITNDDNA